MAALNQSHPLPVRDPGLASVVSIALGRGRASEVPGYYLLSNLVNKVEVSSKLWLRERKFRVQ